MYRTLPVLLLPGRRISSRNYIPSCSVYARYCNSSPSPTETDKLRDVLMTELRSAGFSTQQSEQMLDKSPKLLHPETPGKILKCYLELLRFMPKSSANSAFLKSPILALKDPIELEKINDYVVEKMGKDHVEMAQSRVFEHSLDHLKARHQFLFRAGLYELPNHEGKTRSIQNQPLKKIVDTNDYHFVESTGLSIEEYRAFRNILYLEAEEELEVEEEDVVADSDFRYSEEGEQLSHSKAKSSYHQAGGGRKKRRGKRR